MNTLHKRMWSLLGVVFVFNTVVWFLPFLMRFSGTFLAIGALAYFFGLRHAFDADHIAAIDNVTRKLRQDGKKPVAVGFFFSMGHSTVVILLSLALILITKEVQGQMGALKEIGGLIGTIVSASFLTFIGLINFFIFWKVYRVFKDYKETKEISEDIQKSVDNVLQKRGLMGNFFKFLYKKMDVSWKMYPIGFLFGLGFDTATEIAILGISATMAQNGQAVWQIMIFPLLFTAGMSMMDTLDGIAMMKIYDWAMVDVIRKLFFNMTITGLSVFIALIVGMIEWLQVFASRLKLNGIFWNYVENINFGVLGIVIAVSMIFVWLFSYLYYRKVLAPNKGE